MRAYPPRFSSSPLRDWLTARRSIGANGIGDTLQRVTTVPQKQHSRHGKTLTSWRNK
jgi:hypothetical protein